MDRLTSTDPLGRGSSEAVLSVTPRGRVLSWTRRAELVFGYSRTEAIGRHILSLLVAPEGVDDVSRAIAAALETGASKCHTIRRRKDGLLLPPVELRLVRIGEGPTASVSVHAGGSLGDLARTATHGIEATLGRTATWDVPTPIALQGRDEISREVHDALATSFAPHIMLQRIGNLITPGFVDWYAADLLRSGGPAQRVAVAHRDSGLLPLLETLGPGIEETPPPFSAQSVLRSARPILQPGNRPLVDAPEALGRLGDGAHLILPLMGRTRMLGAITLVRTRGREFDDAEVLWAQDLARRVSIEIENALLVDKVQRLTQAAGDAAERSRQLSTLSSALAEALTPAQLTREAFRHAQDALGASGGAIALLSTDHASFEVSALVDDAEPLSNGALCFPIHGKVPLAEAARSGDIILLEHLHEGAPRYPHLAQTTHPDRALAAVPLVVDGRHVGSVGLVFPEQRAFSADDLEFMRSLARHVANALERARLYGAERAARAQADAEARRSAILADASRILSSSFDHEATLEAAVRLCIPAFADWCAIYLHEADGTLRAVAAVHPDPSAQGHLREFLSRARSEGSSDASISRVVRSGKPEIMESIPDAMLDSLIQDDRTRAALRHLGLSSRIAIPLIARGRTLGILALCSATRRRHALADLQLIGELARRAALAVDNARLFREVEDAYRRNEESVAALRESEERYRLLVDGTPDHALFLLDAAGHIASWSLGAERMLGYSAAEVIGQATDKFYPPEEAKAGAALQELNDARVAGHSETEGWRVRKDGTRYWANVIVTVLRAPDGSVRGFSKLHRDITERRRVREELDLARKRVALHEKLSTMGTLVSGVAHEIRTPLTAIANSIHLVRLLAERGALSPEPVRQHTQLALDGVDRINTLVQDLRRFKRIEARPGTTTLEEVAKEALSLFRAAHRGRVEVSAHLGPTPPIQGDRAQLQQVVLNLLQNASEAMPQGGRIELTTAKDAAGMATMTVHDGGVGMPSDVKSRMFEEFFTTKEEGTGLGLSIVRRIMELHHGRIFCESAPGQGTTFTLLFPTKQDASPAPKR